jgi:hypothetical protein
MYKQAGLTARMKNSSAGTTRIFLENVTRRAEVGMLEDGLPKAIKLIRTTAPVAQRTREIGCRGGTGRAMLRRVKPRISTL